jgi:hypothetical protein
MTFFIPNLHFESVCVSKPSLPVCVLGKTNLKVEIKFVTFYIILKFVVKTTRNIF